MGSYIELAESAQSQESGTPPPRALPASDCWLPPADQYTEWARETLQSIGLSYPLGAVEWLERETPALHHILTVELPAAIEEAWASTAPAEDFRDLLNHFQKTFMVACLLFETRQASGQTSLWFQHRQLQVAENRHEYKGNQNAA